MNLSWFSIDRNWNFAILINSYFIFIYNNFTIYIFASKRKKKFLFIFFFWQLSLTRRSSQPSNADRCHQPSYVITPPKIAPSTAKHPSLSTRGCSCHSHKTSDQRVVASSALWIGSSVHSPRRRHFAHPVIHAPLSQVIR